MNLDLSFREKIMLVILGVVAIIFIGAKLLIIPTSNALSTDKSNFETIKFNVEKAKVEMIQAGSASSSLNKTFNEAKEAASAFLPSLDKPSLSIWIQDIAKKSGLTVNSVEISDPIGTNLSAASFSASGTATASSNSGTADYNMRKYADIYKGNKVSASSSSAVSSSSSSSSSAESSGNSTGSGSKKSTGNNILTSNVQLKMTGSYSGAESFLDAIKATGKYVVVSSFASETENGAFNCEVTLQCYAVQKLDGTDTVLDWKLAAPSGKQDLM